MATGNQFEFRSGTLKQVSIDAESGIIRGVSVIEGGVIAEGHNLLVDDVALKQFFNEAQKKVKVPVKVNHKSGVSELAGYLCNPRLDGKHLRADWHLLRANKDYDLIMEAAEKMPECFGLSTAFRGVPEIVSGQPRARCELLKSVDVVVDPAANTTGLFSARVDRILEANSTTMMNDLETLLAAIQEQGKTLKEFSARLQGVEGNLTEFSDALADAAEEMEGEEGEIDLDSLSDEEVAAILEEAGIDIDDDEEAEFSADDDRVTALENEIYSLKAMLAAQHNAQVAASEDAAFSAIEGKVALMAQELENSRAENQALRQAISGAGVNVAFDCARESYTLTTSNGRKHHEFEAIVDRMWAEDKTKPRTEHFSELVRARPDLYRDYREFMFSGSSN
ncbi:hypothetical protein EBZ80_12960 [bacterium]|nr:hypothetical protein [bacterium]